MLHPVVEQHVEMAGFLWERRRAAVTSYNYTLADLADLETRIDAHLDGLQIAGEPAWELTMAVLADNPPADRDPGALFVAAVGAIEAQDLRRFAAVLDHSDGQLWLADGIAGALAWVSPDDAFKLVEPMQAIEQPLLSWLMLSAFVAHRRDPGTWLTRLLLRDETALRAQACRAVGVLGRTDLVPALTDFFESEHVAERFWSAWAAALLGMPQGSEVLWRIAKAGAEHAETAADCAARISAAKLTHRHIRALITMPGLQRVGLHAVAALGDPALLPWVLDQMQEEELARLAGEVFTRITGIGIAGSLRREPPVDRATDPNDDPADDNVTLNPDTQLAWPDPNAVRESYQAGADGFSASNRYLEGVPVDKDLLEQILREGVQGRRIGAAFERTARDPDKPLFDVSARASRQAAMLSEWL